MPSRSRQSEQPRGKPEDRPKREEWPKGELWEWLAIFFAIAALWPKLLRWPGVVWDITLIVAGVLMVWVFIRRSRRLKNTWKKR